MLESEMSLIAQANKVGREGQQWTLASGRGSEIEAEESRGKVRRQNGTGGHMGEGPDSFARRTSARCQLALPSAENHGGSPEPLGPVL